MVGLKGALWPILRFADSVGRKDALTIPAASFADFCRGFEERIFEGCSGNLRPDVDHSRCNVLHRV